MRRGLPSTDQKMEGWPLVVVLLLLMMMVVVVVVMSSSARRCVEALGPMGFGTAWAQGPDPSASIALRLLWIDPERIEAPPRVSMDGWHV